MVSHTIALEDVLATFSLPYSPFSLAFSMLSGLFYIYKLGLTINLRFFFVLSDAGVSIELLIIVIDY